MTGAGRESLEAPGLEEHDALEELRLDARSDVFTTDESPFTLSTLYRPHRVGAGPPLGGPFPTTLRAGGVSWTRRGPMVSRSSRKTRPAGSTSSTSTAASSFLR